MTSVVGYARVSTREQNPEAQEAELGVFFDTVVVCTVTGSTHAGMIEIGRAHV